MLHGWTDRWVEWVEMNGETGRGEDGDAKALKFIQVLYFLHSFSKGGIILIKSFISVET